jgi:hypothetical protein
MLFRICRVPIRQTKVTGEATVLQLFNIHMEGKLTKKTIARLQSHERDC